MSTIIIRRGILALAVLFFSANVFRAEAQYINEVLRVSQSDYGSTARFKALGNAQTSLGGDLSSLGGNPAGLGFFNQSDFSFSFDFLADRNDTRYFDSASQYSLDKLGINQAGIVLNIPTRRMAGSDLETGWLNFNVGLGYHKTNNYNSALGYSGINPSSTFAHFLADQRDDINPNAEGTFGWESFLLDYNESNPENIYHYPAVLESNNAQKNILNDRGHQSSTNLAFGSNYSNKLFLGFSLGFTSFNYSTKQFFGEDGYTKSYDDIYRENPNSEFLDSNGDAFQLLEAEYALEYNYRQSTQGTGVNATFGLIYKPTPGVNIGFSATTPTWYNISDEGFTYMDVWYYDNAQATEPFHTYNSDEVSDYLEYRVRTPYRINGGISTVFGQGLIAVDLEYIDYSSMHFSASDAIGLSSKESLDSDMNNEIKSNYTSATNFRAGGEYRFTEQFLGRLGYAYRGSPYKDSDLNTQTISGGLGYRIGNMYIDATYQHFTQSYISRPYQIDTGFWSGYNNPEASVTNTRHNAYLTIGFKF